MGVALLIGGVLVDGIGMTLKYHLEQRGGPPLRRERAWFWLSWASPAAQGLWIAVFSADRQRAP